MAAKKAVEKETKKAKVEEDKGAARYALPAVIIIVIIG